MRVTCSLSHVQMDGENGREVPGVTVDCGRCGNSTESYGQGTDSVKRCLARLRESCPRDESNYYEV